MKIWIFVTRGLRPIVYLSRESALRDIGILYDFKRYDKSTYNKCEVYEHRKYGVEGRLYVVPTGLGYPCDNRNLKHENKQLRRANKQHKRDKEIYRTAIMDYMREIENYRVMNRVLDDLLAENRKKDESNGELKKYRVFEEELMKAIVKFSPKVKNVCMGETTIERM